MSGQLTGDDIAASLLGLKDRHVFTGDWGQKPSGGADISGGGEIDFSNMGLANSPDFKKLMGDLQGLVPSYKKAVDDFSNFDELLADYKDEAMGTGRTSFDDVWNTINQAGNVSAARGMGKGTEQTALKSRMLGDLVSKEDERLQQVLSNVLGIETTKRMAGPGTMYNSLLALMSMFGTEAADNLNWAQMISNLIQTGY